MTAQTDRSKPSGRKERDGTEKTITMMPLRKSLRHLASLNDALDAARSSYNAGVKAIAEKTGLMATVINKLVKSRAKDTVFEEARKAEQLSMLFSEFGGEEADPQSSLDSLNTGAAKPQKNGKGAKDGDANAPIGEGGAPDTDPLKGTDLAAKLPEGKFNAEQAERDKKLAAAGKTTH